MTKSTEIHVTTTMSIHFMQTTGIMLPKSKLSAIGMYTVVRRRFDDS